MLVPRLGAPRSGKGFSLIELLLGMTILAIGVLGVASMFSTGYTDVAAGGKTTLALDAARQIMEDIRLVPTQAAFTSLLTLNGVSTATATSLPSTDPGLTIARKFRYLMAGTDAASTWGITSAMITLWGDRPNISGTTFSGQGTIAVTDVGTTASTLYQVTVTVTITGRSPVVLTSLVSRL